MSESDDLWKRKREKLHREPKMRPLWEFTEELRVQTGESVPNFDPDDGGMEAEVLFVFQDPGPTVKDTDFISRDNYPYNKRDYSAKNVTETSDMVKLARERTISWNAVPWRVAEGDLGSQKERAKRERWLTKLLGLFDDHKFRAVALFGGPAREFAKEVREARPDLRIFETWHPGIKAMNQKGKREHFEETFREIKEFLGESPRLTSVGSSVRLPIPDAARLVEAVLERSTGKDSFLHGEGHWRRVAAAGLALLPETPGADPAVVFLFALFHDSMRFNDGHDPLHGPRGAALAGELRGEAFDLDDAKMDLLGYACEEHINGGVGSDATVGVCWDADRLNLWRVGIEPDPRLLSTGAARNGGRIAWARDLQQEHLAWEDLYRGFGLR